MSFNMSDILNLQDGVDPIDLLVMTWLALVTWFLYSRRFWSERRVLFDAFMFIPNLLWEYADWGYWFIGQKCYDGKIPERDRNDAAESCFVLLLLMCVNFSIWSAIF